MKTSLLILLPISALAQTPPPVTYPTNYVYASFVCADSTSTNVFYYGANQFAVTNEGMSWCWYISFDPCGTAKTYVRYVINTDHLSFRQISNQVDVTPNHYYNICYTNAGIGSNGITQILDYFVPGINSTIATAPLSQPTNWTYAGSDHYRLIFPNDAGISNQLVRGVNLIGDPRVSNLYCTNSFYLNGKLIKQFLIQPQ